MAFEPDASLPPHHSLVVVLVHEDGFVDVRTHGCWAKVINVPAYDATSDEECKRSEEKIRKQLSSGHRWTYDFGSSTFGNSNCCEGLTLD